MLDPAIEIRVLTGRDAGLADCLDDLARLRITVFREFPYLYAGDPDYEANYLRTYLDCPDSVVVLALDGTAVIGASTGVPLENETAACRQPFIAAGIEVGNIFYCGESVLLPAYRGRGVYREFFAARERHAVALGRFERMVLCGVVRADDDPRRPRDYQPLDAVWRHFGYRPRPDLVAYFEWQDLDATQPSAKAMAFWEKRL